MSADVCIIIAAYNAAATIDAALASALAQTHVREIIVVDDASSDDTLQRVRALDDGSGRLIAIRQEQNGGPSIARNAALGRASAPWIAVLDADDVMEKGRLAALLKYAHDYDIIADDLWRQATTSDTPRLAWSIAAPRDIDLAAFVRGNLSEVIAPAPELGFVKPLIRRAFMERHGLRYRDEMRLGEDFDLYARALALGARMVLTPAAGYISIERNQSLSKCHGPTDLAAFHRAITALRKDRHLTIEAARALDAHALSVDKRLQWRLLIEAVKRRDVLAGARTMHSPAIMGHLIGQLCAEAWTRTFAALHAPRAASNPGSSS